jgi:hypothetical protein
MQLPEAERLADSAAAHAVASVVAAMPVADLAAATVDLAAAMAVADTGN